MSFIDGYQPISTRTTPPEPPISDSRIFPPKRTVEVVVKNENKQLEKNKMNLTLNEILYIVEHLQEACLNNPEGQAILAKLGQATLDTVKDIPKVSKDAKRAAEQTDMVMNKELFDKYQIAKNATDDLKRMLKKCHYSDFIEWLIDTRTRTSAFKIFDLAFGPEFTKELWHKAEASMNEKMTTEQAINYWLQHESVDDKEQSEAVWCAIEALKKQKARAEETNVDQDFVDYLKLHDMSLEEYFKFDYKAQEFISNAFCKNEVKDVGRYLEPAPEGFHDDPYVEAMIKNCFRGVEENE